jgi:hypothetical protein
MSRFSINRWLQAVARQSRHTPPKRRPKAEPRPSRFLPRLEVLEDRTLPSTFLVVNLNDSGPGSLRAAVAAADANPGSTIDFAAGLHGVITLTSGPLDITSSMTINGPDANRLSVSGNHASRLFDVSSGTNVSLSGLTIANGLSDQGGGIDNLGSLTLNYDTLLGNKAVGDSSTTGNGGGVFNEAGASLSVTGCTFTNNQTVGNVGVGMGGGIGNEGSASVSASTFSANQATGGSAVVIIGPDSHTGAKGGAIGDVFGATLDVRNSTFTGNQALNGLGDFAIGGAIWSNYNSPTTVSSSTFTGNEAQSNGRLAAAGAIFEGGSLLTVSNSTFTDNQALANSTTAEGGAIRVAGGTSCTITGCSFTSNQSIGYTKALGGALGNEGQPASVTNSTFSNNQAIGSGPGALTFGGAIENGIDTNSSGNLIIPSLTLTNCTLTGNQSLGGAGGDGVNTYGFAQGGGIDSSGNVTLQNSTFTDNQAVGGAMAPGAPASSTATSVGGGLSMDQPATLIVANSAFVGNKVVGGAGTSAGGSSGPGIAAIGGGIEDFAGGTATASITNSLFLDNSAVGGAGGSGQPGGDGFGGGLDVSYNTSTTITSATVSGTAFVGNQALGGAGSNAAVSAAANGSSGAGIGGAISLGTAVLFATSDTSSLVLNGCTLTGDVARGGDGQPGGNGGDAWGGGVAAVGGSATISHDTLSDNQALGGTGGSGGTGGNGLGGGLYVASGAVASLCSDTVQFNTAAGGSGSTNGQGYGGGLCIQSGATAYLDASTVASIIDNSADVDPNIDGTYVLRPC